MARLAPGRSRESRPWLLGASVSSEYGTGAPIFHAELDQQLRGNVPDVKLDEHAIPRPVGFGSHKPDQPVIFDSMKGSAN